MLRQDAARSRRWRRDYDHADGLPLPRPRRQLPDRARGRAQAQGDLLHPRRGLPGGRDEARPDRADRRGHAGRRHRHRRAACTTRCVSQHRGGARRAAASVIAVATEGDDGDRGARADDVICVPRTSTSCCTPVLRRSCRCSCSPTTSRVLPRHRRRPAAQPRQERHGRVASSLRRGPAIVRSGSTGLRPIESPDQLNRVSQLESKRGNR